MDFGFKNQHVLVTGASGGIGLETARKFLEQGANVSLHYNRTLSDELKNLQEAYADQAFLVQADACQEEQVVQCVRKCIDHFSKIDVLILNHGVFPAKDVPLCDMTLDQWENTLKVNLTGFFLFAREFLKQLKEAQSSHGNIVMVGSTAAVFGEAGHADYAASKSAAQYGFMLSLKNEIVRIAARGRVNTVAPGWTLTPMAEHAMNDIQVTTRVYQTIPLRKVASTEDVSNSILFLASDKLASHISGHVLTVSGGMEGRVLWNTEEASALNK